MSKYFTVVYDGGKKPKNTAEQELWLIRDSFMGVLINSKNARDSFFMDVRSIVERINHSNKRCNDVRFTHALDRNQIVIGNYLFHIKIYKVNQEFN